MRILSLNLAVRRTLPMGDRLVETGFFKEPAGPSVRVNQLGLDGDFRGTARSQLDHAICVYPREHYGHFERDLGRKLLPGDFGENLTVCDAPEDVVRIGDVFTSEHVKLQVAGPRTPCKKLNLAMGARFSGTFLESTHVGYYLRVLHPGTLTVGETLTVSQRYPENPTVREFVEGSLLEYWEAARLETFRRCPGLAAEWNEALDRKVRMARLAEGWIGLRTFLLLGHEKSASRTRLSVRCARDQPLPLIRKGQTLGLLYRPRPMESPVRLRSVPHAGGSDPDTIGPRAYRLEFESLPPGLLERARLRMSAPQGGSFIAREECSE